MKFDIRVFQILLAPILFSASLLYALIVNVRNFLFDVGVFKSYKIQGIKIISVGNIKAGGTGKTPIVIGIANYLKLKNFKIAIITNAYKAKHKGTVVVSEPNKIYYKPPYINDESYLLAKKTNCVVISTKDRKHALELTKKFNVDCAILDDGLQYRKIEKDLELCIIDKERFFLPFGLLRDSKQSIRRCQKVICFEDCNEVIAKIVVKGIYDMNGIIPKPKSAYVFCAIGNPKKFINTVKELGIKINGSSCYKDHYYYKLANIMHLNSMKEKTKSEVLLTTYKDFVKIEQEGIAYIDIDVELNYEELLKEVL